jgi:peroxiredoxin
MRQPSPVRWLAVPACALLLSAAVVAGDADAVPDDAAAAAAPPGLDFTLRRHGGGNVRLAEYRGDRVLLVLVAPWCAACAGALEDAGPAAVAAGLVPLAVSVTDRGGGVGDVPPLGYPLLVDATRDVMAALDPPELPWLVVVDADGIVAGAGGSVAAALATRDVAEPSRWRRLFWRER